MRRRFTIDDVRVLAYISLDWEDDPDMEAIKCGLNSGGHNEDIFDNLISEVTPIFRELPEGLDETWKNVAIFGGMDFRDKFSLADSYKHAGDMLVNAAAANEDEYELLCPIIYNYRHATELYLKSTIRQDKKNPDHDLIWLFQELKVFLKEKFNSAPPDWFQNIILAFNDFDPDGTSFRYGAIKREEAFIDVIHLKTQMGWLAESFQKIRDNKD